MNTKEIATEIVHTLVKAGYSAYFAGGWVRDYLLGIETVVEDIDIATNAPPEKIIALFPKTLLVGIAFGVVVVVSRGHTFEVATFRRDIDYVDGRKPSQIELSTPEEDALRRDFTINGMFYNPLQGEIIDFVHGREDLQLGIIRAIGDPYLRFTEDKLRMIRAVRFAARFGFSISPETEQAIEAHADTLFPAVAIERVWQEFGKMARYPRFEGAMIEMHRLGLLGVIFPSLSPVHLRDIKKRVASFPLFPQDEEPILFLMQLFPEVTQKEAEELCLYLHTSNHESLLAQYFVSVRQCAENERLLGLVDTCAWVALYAHPAAERCVRILSFSLPNGEAFLQMHHERMRRLAPHIARAAAKTPLVNAARLQAEGIKPGKTLGLLIKEGERIAIVSDLSSVEGVLAHLKQTDLWRRA